MECWDDQFEFNFGSGLNQNIILNIENIGKFVRMKWQIIYRNIGSTDFRVMSWVEEERERATALSNIHSEAGSIV